MSRKESFIAACIQFNPTLNEREKNIEKLTELVYEAAKNGAKFIVTPEMATTGYYYSDRDAIKHYVDTIPGMTTSIFEKICRELNIYIVIGMPEVDPDTDIYYNSAALIGPEGYIGKYRKIHLWEWEAHWAVAGDLGVPVMETPLGNIAINICMDSIYFESSRIAMLHGADILAFPTNSSAQSISFLQSRAETNGLYILSANRSNEEHNVQMVGASAIWSPFGEKLAEAPISNLSNNNPEPVIIYATIYKKFYQNKAKQRIKERVPTTYKEILNYIAPWDFTKSKQEKTITAAIVQCEPSIGNKLENFNKYKKLIKNACKSNKKIQLIVLPELATTGPVDGLSEDVIVSCADDLHGSHINEYKKLAIDCNVSIIFGCIEKENDKLYNTILFIDNSGIIVGKYRKIHLTNSDKRWATAGDKIKVFDTKHLGKIGVMIGYDAFFPEIAGVLAVKRADTIVIPTLWNEEFGREIEMNKKIAKNEYPDGANSLFATIALGSQAYVIVANPIGTELNLSGRSALYTLDPLYGLDQTILASSNKEEVLIVSYTTLQNDWWFNQEKLITLRRTNEYKTLVI